MLQRAFRPADVIDATSTGVTLTVYVCGDLVLVLPRDLAAVVNLLPHSLRGFLSKKGIKTTADAELTEQLRVAAKAFLCEARDFDTLLI